MKTQVLLLSCLLTACSAASPTSQPPGDAFEKKTIPMDISKFQPGDERDSLVKEIGEPDEVSDQANGEKCEVYFVKRNGQETLHDKMTPAGPGPFYGFGNYYNSPDGWQGIDLTHVVVLCYRKDKLVRALSKPCPSAACLNASSSGSPTPIK